jgi:hypothetical protein
MRKQMPEYYDLLIGVESRMGGIGKLELWTDGSAEIWINGDCIICGESYDQLLEKYLSFINEWDESV